MVNAGLCSPEQQIYLTLLQHSSPSTRAGRHRLILPMALLQSRGEKELTCYISGTNSQSVFFSPWLFPSCYLSLFPWSDLLFHHLSRLTCTWKDIRHFESCHFSDFINFPRLKFLMTTLLRAWPVSNVDMVEMAQTEFGVRCLPETS